MVVMRLLWCSYVAEALPDAQQRFAEQSDQLLVATEGPNDSIELSWQQENEVPDLPQISAGIRSQGYCGG